MGWAIIICSGSISVEAIPPSWYLVPPPSLPTPMPFLITSFVLLPLMEKGKGGGGGGGEERRKITCVKERAYFRRGEYLLYLQYTALKLKM